MYFLIDGDGKLLAHGPEANALQKMKREGGDAAVYSTERLAKVATSFIVSAYNSIPGIERVKRFADRRTAIKRLQAALEASPEAAYVPKAITAKPKTPGPGRPRAALQGTLSVAANPAAQHAGSRRRKVFELAKGLCPIGFDELAEEVSRSLRIPLGAARADLRCLLLTKHLWVES